VVLVLQRRCGAGAEIGVDEDNELFAQRLDLALGRLCFEDSAGDSIEGRHDDGGNDFRIFGEAFFCSCEESSYGAECACACRFCDSLPFDVGAYGVQGCACLHITHLCVEVGGEEGGRHFKQTFVPVAFADVEDGFVDLIHVASECSLQQRALVGEVLIEGSDGDACACGDQGGGEALLADCQQNLNGGLQNRVDSDGGTRLNGRLSWLQHGFGGGGQMRTPKLKLTSSKHTKLEWGSWRSEMLKVEKLGGSFTPAGTDLMMRRMGYGAMQLAGPHVWGPPKDRAAAVAVLREAVKSGVDHIDTSDFYGPHVTNQILREALHPYPGVTIVTKVGGRRGADASWLPAQSPDELRRGVEDNLRNLGVDSLDVVNLRLFVAGHGRPNEESVAERFTALAELQQKGLIRHLGLSHASAAQVEEALTIAPVVCVQNQYNLAHREDDALIDYLAAKGIGYVPYFPLGGFTPLQSSTLSDVAERLGATPMQVALAWLLHRAPNVLLIPGTSSVAHLRENLAAATLELSPEVLEELNSIGASAA
jgi:pyridoxine 4-dehydrogenase